MTWSGCSGHSPYTVTGPRHQRTGATTAGNGSSKVPQGSPPNFQRTLLPDSATPWRDQHAKQPQVSRTADVDSVGAPHRRPNQ